MRAYVNNKREGGCHIMGKFAYKLLKIKCLVLAIPNFSLFASK